MLGLISELVGLIHSFELFNFFITFFVQSLWRMWIRKDFSETVRSHRWVYWLVQRVFLKNWQRDAIYPLIPGTFSVLTWPSCLRVNNRSMFVTQPKALLLGVTRPPLTGKCGIIFYIDWHRKILRPAHSQLDSPGNSIISINLPDCCRGQIMGPSESDGDCWQGRCWRLMGKQWGTMN